MPAQTRSKRSASSKDEPSEPPAKAAKTAKQPATKKQGGKVETKQASDGTASTTASLMKRLLSEEVYALAYPRIEKGHGEKDWSEEERVKPLPKEKAGQMEAEQRTDADGGQDRSTGKARGYTSPGLTPFAELICAILLSKPLSHRLGLRTIATLFSPPFGLYTPEALEKAGKEGRREPMYEARTQHKDKTADQLGDVVQGLREICGDNEQDVIQLKAVREAVQGQKRNEAVETARSKLTSGVKGLGPTGVDIFLRRIQAHEGWHAVYPFMDSRTASIAVRLELIDEKAAGDSLRAASDLDEMLNKHVKSASDEKRRQAFTRLLDVLVGLDLEKKLDAVKNDS
ncbi:hypothetical protein IE81DRAFT_325987 [Ceraceosorus guamensis]|uniref:Uncharacterized protein n=1 Tax=Ceraceosorus guamensis TaxID=1522189 RepID=A0A316VUN8_9BASI|nr:hypothetical protein IE81DRAFT_325987 [Ceraceosorus guamensis]PWN39981.1 hypothetical protein IE81DRAFT_325987 [Ceraceosorus guamensis]